MVWLEGLRFREYRFRLLWFIEHFCDYIVRRKLVRNGLRHDVAVEHGEPFGCADLLIRVTVLREVSEAFIN